MTADLPWQGLHHLWSALGLHYLGVHHYAEAADRAEEMRAKIDALTELVAITEDRREAVAELLAALRADPYFHGVWAWRQDLQEGQLGYVRTPEVDRVLRAFAALGAYPATPPSEPTTE
jgi:phosphoglycolate phosphatase-like HAD superfamily hydrolase